MPFRQPTLASRTQQIRQRILRLSTSAGIPADDDVKERSSEDDRELPYDTNRSAEVDVRSGLTPLQSTKARENWRRIAQSASAKRGIF